MAFDDLLAAANLPPPGPEYYAARRKLWLTPRKGIQKTARQPPPGHRKLEALLNLPDAATNDQVWHGGVAAIWMNMATGASLKCGLPLPLMVGGLVCLSDIYSTPLQIKVIYAAWLRDATWPAGAVAPDSDGAPEALTAPPVTSL